jgi:hypothetical protein
MTAVDGISGTRFRRIILLVSTWTATSFLLRRGLAAAGLALLALAWAVTPHGAAAQGRLDAQYEATLAGVPVGRGSWAIEIGDDTYAAAAQGGTAGLLKAFSQGSGTGASQGRIVNGTLVANAYQASTTTGKKSEQIHITLANGNVKEFGIEPQPPVDPDRVPVTEAHRRGVSDPMTATLIRIPGSGDMLGPQACQRTLSIFDGRMRYDLQLAFKRLDRVASERGYQGVAAVCAVFFSPIAGHVRDRYAIQYLAQLRDIELWLVPIAGTRVMVPFRVALPTPLGLGVLQATQFIAMPQPSKATARTQ